MDGFALDVGGKPAGYLNTTKSRAMEDPSSLEGEWRKVEESVPRSGENTCLGPDGDPIL